LRYRILFIALLSSSVCLGGTAIAAAELKVGYVDAKKVLEQAPQAQAMLSKLEKEFEPRKEEVIATQDKLQRLQDKLSRDGDVMSDAERGKIEREAISLRRDLKRSQDDFQEDLNIRRNEELGKLQVLVNQAIDAIGGEGDYDLILYDGIAYANQRLDLTDKVLDWLAKHSKSTADQKKK
jgi:outer membrane protein